MTGPKTHSRQGHPLRDNDRNVHDVVWPIELDIAFGRLKPRERLIEDALMARFNAKRHIVRRALDELARMGLVVREPNRGVAVRDFSAKEVREIYELRELLQGRAVDIMTLPARPDEIAELKRIQRCHDAAVQARDLRQVDLANDDFHRHFFMLCRNDHLVDAISHYAHLTRAMRVYRLSDPAALASLCDEHWAIVQALERRERETLRALVIAHIQPSKNAYLAIKELSESSLS